MKLTKRLFSLLLIPVLLLGSLPISAATGYRDVPSTHWAKADIEWATAKGLMNGTGTNTFSPEGTAERAMLVTVLYRSAGSPAVSASTPFTDLKEDWYKKSVAWAYANGIVNGDSPTTFAPAGKLTREQFATILYRYTKNTLKYNVTVSGSLNKFPDKNKVEAYAKDAMLWANAAGLINGTPINGVAHLDPKGNATRAQMATIFHRFETYKEANKPAPPAPATTTVPNFIGLSKEQAEAAASTAGLTVVFQNNPPEQYDPGYRENTVVAQSLTANSAVTVGSSIVLKINIAPTEFEIPDLSGMTRHQATQAAGARGFGVIFTDGTYDENKEKDTALTQTPAAGSMQPKGTVITVAMNTEPPIITFRVASYNVKHFMHSGGINYEVFAEEINAIDPDIIGLQEIDNGQSRSNKKDQMAEIARAAGYPYYYFAKCVNMNDGEYGHGVLSKYPLKNSQVIKFRAQTGEERTVERHEVTVDGKTVVFYNTHLCYCGEDGNHNNIVKDQPNQMAEIFEWMDLDTYPILVGDMNIAPLDFKDVIDVSRYTPLNGGKTLTDTVNTYPQGTSSYIPIDNIILSDNVGYISTDTDPDGLVMNPTKISDHNLVYADVYLKRSVTVQPAGRVPDLTDMTTEEARTALESKGYQVAFKGAVNESEATVSSQSVAAGTALLLGETVTVTMMVIPTVPEMVGMTLSAAVALLNDLGYESLLSSGSATADKAVVTLQYPAFGTRLVPGNAVTLTARDPESDTFTVASYDVKRFMLEATTGAVDYEAFAKEIAALGPDILGLQAVDKDTANGDQTKKIAEMLGYKYYHYVVSKEDYKDGGDLGNAILSRFPILAADGELFDSQSGETRSYVRAIIDINGTSVTVYNTMLNHNTTDVRNQQFAELTAKMERDNYPILMGNINMPPADLNGKLDLTNYTPLNGGKDLTQIQATCYSTNTTYVSNIILKDCFEALTDAAHPTGLYVSDVANCNHRMIKASVRIKTPVAETLRVASYNVKHFIYGSGINYEVFAEEINEINPDIIGLQEIDKGQSRSGKKDQMEEIAKAAGYPYYYFAKTVDMNDGEYGHGILSKYPITKTENIRFKSQSGEERTVERHEIYVDLTADGIRNGKTLIFYNTHLTLQNKVPQLSEALELMELDTYPILVGDMNMYPIDGAEVIDTSRYTPLNGGKTLQVTASTYPQGSAAYKPIDNIILSDNIGYLSTNTEPDGLTVNYTEISDHNLIYADIFFKDTLVVEPLVKASVPDVVGMSLTAAEAVLREAGFEIAHSASSEKQAADAFVALQYPVADTGLFTGETVTLTARSAAAQTFTVASYDVKRFMLELTTKAVDYEAFAKEIAALGPDILGLQAVDKDTSNGDQTKKIAEMLGYKYYHYVVSKEDYKDGGDLGNAILSRFPILVADGELFASQSGETRSYARAILDIDGTPVTVYNTMLNHNTTNVRNQQFAELTAKMERDSYPILMGNINMPPADLSGKLDLTRYTPLNGGKDLTQIQATCISTTTTYVSNIILKDCFEAVTDAEHPTGLYVSDVANCYHRMIWATIKIKNN